MKGPYKRYHVPIEVDGKDYEAVRFEETGAWRFFLINLERSSVQEIQFLDPAKQKSKSCGFCSCIFTPTNGSHGKPIVGSWENRLDSPVHPPGACSKHV